MPGLKLLVVLILATISINAKTRKSRVEQVTSVKLPPFDSSTKYIILSEACGRALDASNAKKIYLNPFTYRQGQIFRFLQATNPDQYLIAEENWNASLSLDRKGSLETAPTNSSVKWELKSLRRDHQVAISVRHSGRVYCLKRSWGSRVKVSKCKYGDKNQKWILVPICDAGIKAETASSSSSFAKQGPEVEKVPVV